MREAQLFDPIKTTDKRGNIGWFISRFKDSWEVRWE